MRKDSGVAIGIAGNRRKPLARKAAANAIRFLEKMKIKFFVDSGFLNRANSIPLKKIRADFFLVFGGDGTLLHIVREMGKQKPVLGVNCGTHGHLMLSSPKNLGETIKKIVSGKFSVEERSRISVVVDGKPAPSALNEVIIAPRKSFTLTGFSLEHGGNSSGFSADAVVVSTPTGSTAFVLAAGGKPIAASESLFEILPVNLPGGKLLPQFVPDDEKVSVFPTEKNVGCEAIIDGQRRVAVKKRVVMKRSKEPALFAVLH